MNCTVMGPTGQTRHLYGNQDSFQIGRPLLNGLCAEAPLCKLLWEKPAPPLHVPQEGGENHCIRLPTCERPMASKALQQRSASEITYRFVRAPDAHAALRAAFREACESISIQIESMQYSSIALVSEQGAHSVCALLVCQYSSYGRAPLAKPLSCFVVKQANPLSCSCGTGWPHGPSSHTCPDHLLQHRG